MSDLNKLSPTALSAAMRGGTSAWGQWGSAKDHILYVDALPKKYTRRRCHCGCKGRRTHIGKANGVGLMWGCELSVRRWAKEWSER